MHTHKTTSYYRDICTCDFHAPAERVLRSPAFNQALARYWLSWELSIPGLVNQVTIELLDHHGGRLFQNGVEIARFDVNAATGNDWIDTAFGSDPFREMHNYLKRAEHGFRNQLRKNLMQRALVLHFSREVAECTKRRTSAATK